MKDKEITAELCMMLEDDSNGEYYDDVRSPIKGILTSIRYTNKKAADFFRLLGKDNNVYKVLVEYERPATVKEIGDFDPL